MELVTKSALSAWAPAIQSSARLGQTTLTLEERDAALARVALGRERMAEIVKYTEGLPSWALSEPFREHQAHYDQVLDVAFASADTVKALAARLEKAGPWGALSDVEVGSLSSWSNAIEELYDIYLRTRPDPYAVARVGGAAAAVAVLYALVV